jgi:ankyrin repeat protein
MPRRMTPATSLENLKKEAKRWLKAIRAGDEAACARLSSAVSKMPPAPGLRDVQHALAREYGCANWNALKLAVEQRPSANSTPEARAQDIPAQNMVTRFLEYACPDHHVRGPQAHRMARHAAMRILDQHPGIARDSLYTAVVCGEIEAVERILRERPELANAKNASRGRDRAGAGGAMDFLQDLGTKAWQPLLYLCFTRLPLAKADDHVVAIARMLLDRGADPNAYFMAGDSRYTPLVGVIGEGEEGRPPHPRRAELSRLLLERGAEPYDGQVIYNIHFHGKILWWMELMYEFSVTAGRADDWNDPEWHMLDQGGYGTGARWHLWTAIQHNDLELAEWCLSHGANPAAGPPRATTLPQHSLYEQAIRRGHLEMAELLVRYGAKRHDVPLNDEERFVAACLRRDRGQVQRVLSEHPEYLRSPAAMFEAARQDRADVVELLLDVGVPIEIEDAKKQRPLHVAAAADAVHVAELLIARGAEVDPYELNYSNTPLDFAVYYGHTRTIELLARRSRDVWNLTFIGAVDRLRDTLSAEPQLATISWQTSPLFWLPEEEEKALEIARLFLEHGADPGFRSKKDGLTAADVARRRGMHNVAALLDASAGATGDSEQERRAYVLETCEQLARDLATVYESDDVEALERLGRHFNRIVSFQDVRASVRRRVDNARQREPEGGSHLGIDEARDVIARQSGFRDWTAFVDSLATGAPESQGPFKASSVEQCERLANDLVLAFDDHDEAALARLNEHYRRSFTFDDLWAEVWRRVYSFRQRAFSEEKRSLAVEEAQSLIAQDAGFGSWAALTHAVAAGARPLPAYAIDTKENLIAPRRHLTDSEWDDLIAVMKEHRITALEANGLMTDTVLARVAALEHVTDLSLGGSRQLTDEGLRHLARMPQLQRLNLNEYPGGRLTDRGLEVVRHLTQLRTFEMTWQRGITDAGVANLRFCDHLERVDLMGSPCGDGAIEALQGKSKLRDFSTGKRVTDAGLRLLHNFPKLKTWHGGSVDARTTETGTAGARLLIDGPFTNGGLAMLAGLEGIADLDLFWHVTGISSDGFAHLLHLSHLRSLGADGALSDDVAMRYIAAMPRLRRLRAQGTVASDEGFAALSQSQTIESIWGRECPNLGSRGFVALSHMPALRSLGVSCRNVDDAALSTLARFPALRELTPIDVHDDGFRHVGRCERLDRLKCMYCRDTTDAATEHIAALRLTYYYAGLTQITDRSLEILGRMPPVEQIDLYECKGITDAGLGFLAGLPRLREIHLEGLPGVTLDGTRVFPAHVRVKYST